MTAAALPAHVVAVLGAVEARPLVARALRRVRLGGGVLLVVGPGAVAPEGVDLETAGRALVGIVDGVRGVEIAAARSAAAAEHMRAELGARGAVGLYLDAGQRCAVMPVPSTGAPSTWGDA